MKNTSTITKEEKEYLMNVFTIFFELFKYKTFTAFQIVNIHINDAKRLNHLFVNLNYEAYLKYNSWQTVFNDLKDLGLIKEVFVKNQFVGYQCVMDPNIISNEPILITGLI